MRQTLLLQLYEDAERPCEWRLQAHGASTPLQTGCDPLNEVLERDAHARLIVLVPSEQLLLTQVKLPIRQPGKLLQAVPYALEEHLAEDVESLHFAIGGRQPDGTTPVAVVGHAVMQDWLARFGDAAARIDILLPDVLALPVDESGQTLYIGADGRCLVRQGDHAGFAVPLDLLNIVWPGEAGGDMTVYRHEQAPEPSPELALPESTRVRSDSEVLHELGNVQTRINLLQGRYAPKREFEQWLRVARLPAALAASWLIVATASLAMGNHQKAEELERLRDQAQSTFQTAFPQITRIVDMRVQAEQQLERLRGGQASGGFLPLLSQSAPVLARVKKLKLEGLQFRDGSLYLSLSGSDLQALEELRSAFAQVAELKLDVQSAQAGTEGVQIRLKVDAA